MTIELSTWTPQPLRSLECRIGDQLGNAGFGQQLA